MAAHQLTIERAKFSACLLKPDIPTVNRDQVAVCLERLDKAVSRCSPSNIQSCIAWLLSNIVSSSPRVVGLGKYLVALANAEDTSRNEDGYDKKTKTSSSTCRKRLHILYLLNDLLHHTKYHTSNSSSFPSFVEPLQPFITELVQLASRQDRPKIRTRIDSLLQVWEEDAYFSKGYVDKLKESAVPNATGTAGEAFVDRVTSTSQIRDEKDQAYLMPASHGDSSTPYYDLPAGNLMPHIMPNRSIPIRMDDVRALQFAAGPADDNLVVALKHFMSAVEKLDNPVMDVHDGEGNTEDVDELGQPLLRDEAGEFITGHTYYGWSRAFCEKMRGRSVKKVARSGRERSYSSSRSRSRNRRKRRRYSHSTSSTSASYSRSRSRNRSNYNNFGNGRQENSSSERGHHDNRPSSQPRIYNSTFQPAMSQSDTQPPEKNGPFHEMSTQGFQHPAYPLPEGIPLPPSLSAPHKRFSQHVFPPPPLGLGNLPIPPPVNYSGPWPPPPPPPPSNMVFKTSSSNEPYYPSQGFSRPPSYQGEPSHGSGSDHTQWPR
ncbi:hypothetical protein EPUS_03865 [Endocarpon pusillum Z07020]|uniref:CID domain-containing protein n=1 Tax=Endocarpon pusillum (strain Z07020 / HMAS-L-300199) TaxID=1263415 RepID=U1HTV4_ENDPU|nr:uncharacterized protein EPUS_03865 [Endocarpon pusillum Z07020]ERF74050.1 hypothetical protein EPUS_03865 [Endocarpon pusillum Z07020]